MSELKNLLKQIIKIMVSRWEDVAGRVAEKTGIEYELVLSHIKDIAKTTKSQIINPTTPEIEVFGVVYLRGSRMKTSRFINHHKDKISKANDGDTFYNERQQMIHKAESFLVLLDDFYYKNRPQTFPHIKRTNLTEKRFRMIYEKTK